MNIYVKYMTQLKGVTMVLVLLYHRDYKGDI